MHPGDCQPSGCVDASSEKLRSPFPLDVCCSCPGPPGLRRTVVFGTRRGEVGVADARVASHLWQRSPPCEALGRSPVEQWVAAHDAIELPAHPQHKNVVTAGGVLHGPGRGGAWTPLAMGWVSTASSASSAWLVWAGDVDETALLLDLRMPPLSSRSRGKGAPLARFHEYHNAVGWRSSRFCVSPKGECLFGLCVRGGVGVVTAWEAGMGGNPVYMGAAPADEAAIDAVAWSDLGAPLLKLASIGWTGLHSGEE
jgi:hypothetical protein